MQSLCLRARDFFYIAKTSIITVRVVFCNFAVVSFAIFITLRVDHNCLFPNLTKRTSKPNLSVQPWIVYDCKINKYIYSVQDLSCYLHFECKALLKKVSSIRFQMLGR